MRVDGPIVIERLRELPGGAQLLEVAREHDGVELVGGAVRDILLGRKPRELDTLVESDVQSVVDALVERLGGRAVVHERFGTALISAAAVKIDLVRARAEYYPAPGALPEVRQGTLEQDLERRDFTVNAIAVALAGERAGELRAVEHALEDLEGRRLRVLHERSFIDDPTRLMRLARYAGRLGFEVEERTAELAGQALGGGALATVSPARVGAELRLALAEPRPLEALRVMEGLGVLGALDGRLNLREEAVERALELLPEGAGRRDLLVLASLAQGIVAGGDARARADARALLDAWQFPAPDRDRTVAAAVAGVKLATGLGRAQTDSRLHALASGAPLEGVALAGAAGGDDAARAAARWLGEVRNVRLAITGEDLIAAGVRQGPEIGRRLDAVLKLRLDGELADGREAQLRAALGAKV